MFYKWNEAEPQAPEYITKFSKNDLYMQNSTTNIKAEDET